MKNILTLVMLLSTLSVIDVGTSLTTLVYGQENIINHTPGFLYIQHANSGLISEINATFYELELNDVSNKTILFSERPDRIVTSESTVDFIGNWSTGEDSFAIDAPNAVLVIDKIKEQNVTVIELFNPIYDVNENALKYEVTFFNTALIDLPEEFKQPTLIIDCSCCSGRPGC